jgi:CHAT domain-containing protein
MQKIRLNPAYRIVIFVLLAVMGATIAIAPVWANSPERALALAREGQQHYNAGQFDRAVQSWQAAADVFEQAGDREGMTKSLVNQAQALQELGLNPQACKTLLRVFAVAPDCSSQQVDRAIATLSKSTSSSTQAIGLRSLGEVRRRQGFLAQSETILKLALVATKDTPQEGATLLSLGNVGRALGNQTRDRWDYQEISETIDRQSLQVALAPYERAFESYMQAGSLTIDSLSPLQAKLNHFRLLLEIQDWWRGEIDRRLASWSRLGEEGLSDRALVFKAELAFKLKEQENRLQSQIESSLATLPLSSAAVDARINYAQSLMQGRQRQRVAPLLETALQQARSLQDKRAETYALGYLGSLYYQERQLARATDFTRQALALAQQQNVNGDARESVYLWQSQLGSILKEGGQTQEAIAAYAGAVKTLQSLRSDINANGRDVQFDFLREVKPVYLELVDLLLRADVSQVEELDSLNFSNTRDRQSETRSRSRLELAREAIEALQLAELDNFFQDPCSEEADVAVRVDDIDPRAAVIYPIVLKDRLEVILSLPNRPLQAATAAVSEQQVNDTLDRLYDALNNVTANDSARNIFATANPDPIELKENLQQLLPIFEEIYGWLVRPFESELTANKIENLVFVTNGRLQKVPMAALYDGKQYAIEKYGVAIVASLQLLDYQKVDERSQKVLAAGVSEQIQVKDEFFPALASVPQELKQIVATFPASQALLNREFTLSSLQKRLQDNFSIVHLATHGLFSSNPQNNFIITGDGDRISIDRLTTLLREDSQAIELLVLSACETATGDERAVLGLAGVAIRSGARSTLASLWAVEDASTAELMGHFYEALERSPKKVSALKSAQLSLLNSLKNRPIFQELKDLPPHPYLWSPFVLVGNWQ